MNFDKEKLKKLWRTWTPTQEKFVFDFEHPEQLFIGGWGCGKTTAGCRKAILLSFLNPGSVGMISRFTMRELEDSTMQTFFNEIEGLKILKNYHYTRKLAVIQSIGNTPSVVLFRALDDPVKFQSLELHYIYIDEAHEALRDEYTYHFLSKRLRLKGMPKHYFFLTSASPPKKSYLYQLFVEQKSEDRICYKASTVENKDNLPPSYFKKLEEMPVEYRRRYLEGEWGSDIYGKPVFTEFNRKLHVNENLKYIPGLSVIRSWDFGFHRPVVLWLQIDHDGNLNVLDELVGLDIYLTDFADKVIKHSVKKFPFAEFEDTCDPSGSQYTDKGKTSLEILRDFGITPFYRRTPVLERVYMIKKLLTTLRAGRPVLQIHPRCEVLIDAMLGGYHFPETTSPKVKDEPFKDGYYDHVVDALGYAVSIYFPTDIPTITTRIKRPVAVSSEKRYLTPIKKL